MSKSVRKPSTAQDMTKYCRSIFTLTFAVEVVESQVWEDCNEGLLEQGSCDKALKLQYQLYPGQTYELEILIWPHTAKISYGTQSCWVRTWQFLERRWLTFSISHAFPVRVLDLQAFVATVNPSFGASVKNDKNFKVYLPPLGFGVRRYFAPVLETQESLLTFLYNLIWHAIEQYIPSTCFDVLLDVPHVVTDVRHQDACIDKVRDVILKRLESKQEEQPAEPEIEETAVKSKRESKIYKDKDKKKGVEVVKLEIKLSGESILAGAGRIVPFETSGDPLPSSPEIIALISSNNLPAQDDLPIVFLNVENLCQIPLNELKILRITQIYTKWKLGDEVHCSHPQPLKTESTVGFNDHRALPLPSQLLPKIISEFLDTHFVIELRGIRLPPETKKPILFGYERGDRDFGKTIPKPTKYELDFVIATTRIDTRKLARGLDTFISGEYPLFPPRVTVQSLEREGFCTNDINCVRANVVPDLVVQPEVVLQAQMSLEVSIGVVGCKTRHLPECYSRMISTVKDSEEIMSILRCITEINNEIILSGKKDDLLSGFALDTGDVVVLYVEGPRDGHILRIWEMTEDFYPKVKPVFSCSDRYSTRIYPELITAAVPFIVWKMFVPLNVLLACPPVYARPALPLPTRAAVLKLGALIGGHLRSFPPRCKMPTADELKSFRLELCVAPRPPPIFVTDTLGYRDEVPLSLQSATRINWHNTK